MPSCLACPAITCGPFPYAEWKGALRYERLFVLKRVAGQWRIDVLKKRLFRTEAWSSAIL